MHLIEAVPQTQQFRFSHALIRETLYDEMLGLRRARLHLRIGEMLEQRYGADDATALPQLAYHFSEAGPGDAAGKALDYARRSAEHAARLLAFEEAVRLYHLSLHLQQQHFAKDAAQRCGLLLALGEVQFSLGHGEPARAAYQEAAELARSHGLAAPFAQAARGLRKKQCHGRALGRAGGGLVAGGDRAAPGGRRDARRTAGPPVPCLPLLRPCRTRPRTPTAALSRWRARSAT